MNTKMSQIFKSQNNVLSIFAGTIYLIGAGSNMVSHMAICHFFFP